MDLKSVATLLTRYYAIQKLLGLSNEILSINVAQGAAKLQEVKVGGLKKMLYLRMQGKTFSCSKDVAPCILKPIFSDLNHCSIVAP